MDFNLLDALGPKMSVYFNSLIATEYSGVK